ncbi:MAG: GntR family transcriptional regulator, partial [Candidatus Promineifilaceae bacterium]
LEALASRLAAQTITEEGKAQLKGALATLKTAVVSGEQNTIVDADFALHMVVFQLSQHKLLLVQYRKLESLTRLYMNTLSGYRANLDELLDEHIALVAAIASGDADRAERIAQEHNSVDGQFLQRQLSEVHASEKS